MDRTRHLFNRGKKDKDSESINSTDSIYNYLNDNRNIFPEEKVEDNLYPINEVNDMILTQLLEDGNSSIDEQLNRHRRDDKQLFDIVNSPIIEEVVGEPNTVNNYENTSAYMLNNAHYCHYAFDTKTTKKYSKQQEEYRNDVIFNYNHNRFNGSTVDPWLFVEHKDIDWPSYVTDLYYTRLTPKGELIRLSYSSILYLNKLFKSQDFAPVLRLKHYPIYELASRLMRQPLLSDIKNEFINEDFVANHGNVEIIKKDGSIMRDFINTDKSLEVFKLTDEQPTDISFNSFFDYIPICFYPSFSTRKPESLFFSNICFHHDGCHDYWCSTHNDKNICLLHRHEHEPKQKFFNLEDLPKTRVIDYYQLISE